MLALAAAAEIRHLNLPDALELTLLLAARDQVRFPRAAARWQARYTLEARGVGLAEADFVLSALAALPGPTAHAGLRGLEELFERRQESELAAAVQRCEHMFDSDRNGK
jgi:hypothetical protein